MVILASFQCANNPGVTTNDPLHFPSGGMVAVNVVELLPGGPSVSMLGLRG